MTSWQVCSACGNVYVLWNDPTMPERLPMGPMFPEWFCYADGTPVDPSVDPRPCVCGAGSTSAEMILLFHPAARRWGDVPARDESFHSMGGLRQEKEA